MPDTEGVMDIPDVPLVSIICMQSAFRRDPPQVTLPCRVPDLPRVPDTDGVMDIPDGVMGTARSKPKPALTESGVSGGPPARLSLSPPAERHKIFHLFFIWQIFPSGVLETPSGGEFIV